MTRPYSWCGNKRTFKQQFMRSTGRGCCRAQRIHDPDDCRWQSYHNASSGWGLTASVGDELSAATGRQTTIYLLTKKQRQVCACRCFFMPSDRLFSGIRAKPVFDGVALISGKLLIEIICFCHLHHQGCIALRCCCFHMISIF